MKPTRGPLQVSTANPRYFRDRDGRMVWLTGSHTWANLATDQGDAVFDFTEYLRWMRSLGHNFIRGWNWDLPWSRQGFNGGPFRFGPQPFERTGPGDATDGRPRFDLGRRNSAFFDRVRARTIEAAESGVYVSIMLFQGFAWQFNRLDHDGMPYDGRNNVNGIDAGPAGAAATLGEARVLTAQERYIEWVVDAVGDLDNVLYEIANEASPDSTAWQRHMIEVVRGAESRRGVRHPIGMTFQFDGGTLAALEQSKADWISPDSDPTTRAVPPVQSGGRVVVFDTDHGYDWRALRADGPARQRAWIWRCLMRGAGGVLFMDPYLAAIEIDGETRNAPQGVDPRDPSFGRKPDPFWNPLRRAMGHARRFAEALPLEIVQPRPDAASTGWCLAGDGFVAAYTPSPGRVRVDVRPGRQQVTWFDPATGAWTWEEVLVAPADGRLILTATGRADGAVVVRAID